MTQTIDMVRVRKGDRTFAVAGTCECGTFVTDADGTLEWSNGIQVFCRSCA